MTKPTAYGPELAPPGVECHWINNYQSRAKQSPRLLLLHTNGASGPGSLQSALNWANAAPSNTKPHYQVQRDGSAWKLLPSDRVGIANYKAAPFSLAIETQDLGYPTPGEAAGYTPEQLDTIARIIAFEHITHNGRIPLEIPRTWDGYGIGSHTDPFSYPYWTNARGKVCPGRSKKAQLGEVIVKAHMYVVAWTQPDPQPEPPTPPTPPAPYEGNDMFIVDLGVPGVDSYWTRMLFTGTELTHVTGQSNPFVGDLGLPVHGISTSELLGLLATVRTVGPSPFYPGGVAPNGQLHAAWNAALTH